MSDNSKAKVVVVLSDADHAALKRIAKTTRRTMGQELAFRAFREIRRLVSKDARKSA